MQINMIKVNVPHQTEVALASFDNLEATSEYHLLFDSVVYLKRSQAKLEIRPTPHFMTSLFLTQNGFCISQILHVRNKHKMGGGGGGE